jgi:hypothetical protein
MTAMEGPDPSVSSRVSLSEGVDEVGEPGEEAFGDEGAVDGGSGGGGGGGGGGGASTGSNTSD